MKKNLLGLLTAAIAGSMALSASAEPTNLLTNPTFANDAEGWTKTLNNGTLYVADGVASLTANGADIILSQPVENGKNYTFGVEYKGGTSGQKYSFCGFWNWKNNAPDWVDGNYSDYALAEDWTLATSTINNAQGKCVILAANHTAAVEYRNPWVVETPVITVKQGENEVPSVVKGNELTVTCSGEFDLFYSLNNGQAVKIENGTFTPDAEGTLKVYASYNNAELGTKTISVTAKPITYMYKAGDVLTKNLVNYTLVGENLITNGDFSDGMNGWIYKEGALSGGSIVEGPTADYKAYAGKGKGSADPTTPYIYKELTAGKTYFFSFWYNCASGRDNKWDACGLADKKNFDNIPTDFIWGGGNDGSRAKALKNDGKWINYSVIFTVPEGKTIFEAKFPWLRSNDKIACFNLFELEEEAEVVGDNLMAGWTRKQAAGQHPVYPWYGINIWKENNTVQASGATCGNWTLRNADGGNDGEVARMYFRWDDGDGVMWMYGYKLPVALQGNHTYKLTMQAGYNNEKKTSMTVCLVPELTDAKEAEKKSFELAGENMNNGHFTDIDTSFDVKEAGTYYLVFGCTNNNTGNQIIAGRDFKFVDLGETTGIEAIETEGGEAVYYNLNGLRVNADALVDGIYVKVTNGKAEKVMVRK